MNWASRFLALQNELANIEDKARLARRAARIEADDARAEAWRQFEVDTDFWRNPPRSKLEEQR